MKTDEYVTEEKPTKNGTSLTTLFQTAADASAAGRIKDVVTVILADENGEPTEVQIEVRPISAGFRGEYLARVSQMGSESALAQTSIGLVISSAHDPETGERIFTEKSAEMLKQVPAGPIEAIAAAAVRVSGLDKVGFEEGKGRSSPTRKSSSTSS